MSREQSSQQIGEQLNDVFSEFIIKPMDTVLETRLQQQEKRWFGEKREDYSCAEFLLKQQKNDIKSDLDVALTEQQDQIKEMLGELQTENSGIIKLLKAIQGKVQESADFQAQDRNDLKQILQTSEELARMNQQLLALTEKTLKENEKTTAAMAEKLEKHERSTKRMHWCLCAAAIAVLALQVVNILI